MEKLRIEPGKPPEILNLDTIQGVIATFQQCLNQDANPMYIYDLAHTELRELEEAIGVGNLKGIASEIADVSFLLISISNLIGFNLSLGMNNLIETSNNSPGDLDKLVRLGKTVEFSDNGHTPLQDIFNNIENEMTKLKYKINIGHLKESETQILEVIKYLSAMSNHLKLDLSKILIGKIARNFDKYNSHSINKLVEGGLTLKQAVQAHKNQWPREEDNDYMEVPEF